MPGAWAVTSPQTGTSGDLWVSPLALGTFAVLSLMTGSAVERLVPEPLSGNLSGIEKEQLDAQRVGAAAAVAFGSGALMVRDVVSPFKLSQTLPVGGGLFVPCSLPDRKSVM